MIPKRGPAAETLRARGLRLTEPRRLILDVVRATDAHPSASTVYRQLRKRLPRVSLATVYRNLALPDAARRAFPTAEVALVVDHPNERARTVLSPAAKANLAQDLA